MRTFVGLSFAVSALVALPLVAGCSSSSSAPQQDVDGGSTATPDGATTTPVTTLDSAAPVETDSSAVADTGTTQPTSDAAACELPTGGPTNSPTCNTCLQTNCCSAVLTCLNDSACLALNNCLANCQQGELPNDGGTFSTSTDGGVQSCETTCLTGVPTSVQEELQAEEACINTGGACVTACQ